MTVSDANDSFEQSPEPTPQHHAAATLFAKADARKRLSHIWGRIGGGGAALSGIIMFTGAYALYTVAIFLAGVGILCGVIAIGLFFGQFAARAKAIDLQLAELLEAGRISPQQATLKKRSRLGFLAGAILLTYWPFSMGSIGGVSSLAWQFFPDNYFAYALIGQLATYGSAILAAALLIGCKLWERSIDRQLQASTVSAS